MNNSKIDKNIRDHFGGKRLRRTILFCLLLMAGIAVSAGEMTEAGLGVYIYASSMKRCANSWNRKLDDFLAEHFAILEKNGVTVIHLAVEAGDDFKNLYLPLLEKHKIKALLQLNFAYFRNTGDWGNPKYMDRMAHKAADFINQYKSHPNVLAFSIREEAAANQMKMLSDYYKKILNYAPGAHTFFLHNNIAAAKAHLEPYPQILGTDRYNFFFMSGKNSYVASPSS